MTQRDRLNAPTLETPSASSELPELDATNLVDAYADNLMGDLFGEVERILEGEIELSNDYAEPQLASPSEPEAAFSAYANDSVAGAIVPFGAGLKLASPTLPASALSESAAIPPETAPPHRWFGRPFDRFFLSAACMSLVFTLLLWLVDSQYRARQQVTVAPNEVMTAAELRAEADRQYVEYLERSLNVIDQQREVASAAVPPAQLPTVALNPLAGVPGGTSGILPPLPGTLAASPQTSVIERVYIPVYQPPQTLYQTPPAGTAATRTPAPTAAANTPQPAQPPQAASAVAASHLLSGILELGDRSAALFEVDGVPQHVYIGQPIGSSGWTLVSVANQRAVVRRNGDVRSVIVGQKF